MATATQVLTRGGVGKRGPWSIIRRLWRVLRRYPVFPGGVILTYIFVAVFAPWLAPHPFTLSLPDMFKPPFWVEGGSINYLLGTDKTGRDIFSGLIFGARTAMIVTAVSLLVAGTTGTTLGILSGYLGGRWDMIIMRVADVFMGFPLIYVTMLLVLVWGNSLANVVIMVALGSWARFSRTVRSEVLRCRNEPYVLYAKVAGTSTPKILWRHIFPSVMNTVLVLVPLGSGVAIMLEAGMSFIGVGVPAGTASWGAMVTAGRDYIATAWWVTFFPGLVIGIFILASNLFGDWLREALDPKRRQV